MDVFDHESNLIKLEQKLIDLEKKVISEVGSGVEIKLSTRISEVLALAKKDLEGMRKAEQMINLAKKEGKPQFIPHYEMEFRKHADSFVNHSKLLEHYLKEEEQILDEKMLIIKNQRTTAYLAEKEAKKKARIV